MGKGKMCVCFITIIVSLLGCVPADEKVNTENNTGYIETFQFVSNDENVSFKVYNQANVSQEELEDIKLKTIEAYDFILESIKNNYERASEINIYLKEGTERSSASKTTIHLFKSHGYSFPLVHELTHSLLGIGKGFDHNAHGHLTQEGLAEYMQYEIGELNDLLYNIPVHKKMKYLIERNKNIPLYKLVDLKIEQNIFFWNAVDEQENTLIWIGYVQAGSFVTYLIDKYGFENFSSIYNHPELNKQVKFIYNKSIEELEKEWIEYVNSNTDSLSTKELNAPPMLYYQQALDLIDKDIFERE